MATIDIEVMMVATTTEAPRCREGSTRSTAVMRPTFGASRGRGHWVAALTDNCESSAPTRQASANKLSGTLLEDITQTRAAARSSEADEKFRNARTPHAYIGNYAGAARRDRCLRNVGLRRGADTRPAPARDRAPA